MPKNPPGFPERLDYLMKGAGLTSRDLSAQLGGKVSHATIENWLNDATRAGDDVELVAKFFGWQTGVLFFGTAPLDAATRIAELEGALGELRRQLQSAVQAATRALGEALPSHPPTRHEGEGGEPVPDRGLSRSAAKAAVGQRGKPRRVR